MRDNLVPHAWGRAMTGGSRAAVFNVERSEYYEGLTHNMSRAEIAVLLQWITVCIGDVNEQQQQHHQQQQRQVSHEPPVGARSSSGSSLSSSSSSSAAACIVRYGWSRSADGSDGCIAAFRVGAGARALLTSQPLAARGAYFNLTCSDEDEDVVLTVFDSPAPEATADALALRIEARLKGGAPPGANECAISGGARMKLIEVGTMGGWELGCFTMCLL
eukprot:TRINITY_DN4726_c0_g2_i2.p1 TRINITY_DN4726_c0_g2~~TRINITY_DN4726_c0_g2_i2.p1  ORF type:complete len:218 (+),score=74.32 TRINITY_DN4726_c0_g2_i2:897-1550(+)